MACELAANAAKSFPGKVSEGVRDTLKVKESALTEKLDPDPFSIILDMN